MTCEFVPPLPSRDDDQSRAICGEILSRLTGPNGVFDNWRTWGTPQSDDAVDNLLAEVAADIRQRQPTVPRDGFDCPDCGHSHTNERMGFICIGCPCSRTSLESATSVGAVDPDAGAVAE